MHQDDGRRGVPGPDGSRSPGAMIDCLSCRHFYITYDPSFPYGCRVVGFKSRRMPLQEVVAHSGIDCQFFTEKEKGKRR